MRDHVLDIARLKLEAVPWDAVIEELRNNHGGVHALVPRPAPCDDQFPAREQQGRAHRLMEPHGYGRELALVVEGEGEHLVDLVQIQGLHGPSNL